MELDIRLIVKLENSYSAIMSSTLSDATCISWGWGSKHAKGQCTLLKVIHYPDYFIE